MTFLKNPNSNRNPLLGKSQESQKISKTRKFSKFSKISKMLKILKNSQKSQKSRKFSKISKISKILKNLKNLENSQNLKNLECDQIHPTGTPRSQTMTLAFKCDPGAKYVHPCPPKRPNHCFDLGNTAREPLRRRGLKKGNHPTLL